MNAVVMARSATRDPEHSLGAELRRAAREAPDHVFIRMMNGEWSFAWVDEKSDMAARALHARGVRRGENVSLMLPNGIEFVVLWFALAKLGAVAAPVNTAFRGESLRAAIDLVQSRLLFVHASLQGLIGEVRAALQTVRNVLLVGVPAQPDVASYETLFATSSQVADVPWPDVAASDLALLLYTSGTTGRSKASMMAHRFVLGHARLTIEGLDLRADDVLYCPYPMFHLDAAVMTIAPALLLRATAAIGERFSVSRFWHEVRTLKATVFDFMGATLTMLWKQEQTPQDHMHHLRLGWGVPLPEWAPQFEQRFGCRLVELYGSTELGTFIFTPLDQPRRVGSCGKVRGPFEVRLQSEEGEPVAPGQSGEMLVRSTDPGLITAGYFGMPEATQQALRDGWFHTGDLLRQDEDGYLYFVGRFKDMVRRRGENISAAEVEMAIETHPQVLECAVFGVPSEFSEEDVMACVVARPGTQLGAEALIEFCASRMARFMLPRYIRMMAALPKTPTDKIEKDPLRQQGVTHDTWDRERIKETP